MINTITKPNSILNLKSLIKISLLLFILVITATKGQSQENFTIKMSFKAEGLPPEYAAYAEQDILVHIKGDKLKTERNSMMGSSVSLYDGEKMTAIMENMGNKMGYIATKQELETLGKNENTEKPTIEYTSDKKMIAGYECTKVIATSVDKDKKETQIVFWVTDKISYNHPEAHKANGKGMMDLSELKGYPLAMEFSQNNQGMDIKFIMTATEILTTPIDDSVFTVSTEGYTMISYAEMLEKEKNMSKGR